MHYSENSSLHRPAHLEPADDCVDVPAVDSVRAVLLLLRNKFAKYGLRAFRYYFLQRDTTEKAAKGGADVQEVEESEIILGVESVGHEDDDHWQPGLSSGKPERSYPVPEMFRAGNWYAVRRRLRRKPRPGRKMPASVARVDPWIYAKETNSFLCFNTKNTKPLVFYHDPQLKPDGGPDEGAAMETPHIEERHEAGVPNFVTVQNDYGAFFLSHVKTGHWIDFPMDLGGEFVGKITADISSGLFKDKEWELEPLNLVIMEAAAMIGQYTPLLEAFRARDWHDDFREVETEIRNLRTLGDLYEYCVSTLAQKPFFQTKYASIFTSLTDYCGRDKLVLRCSSYPELRQNDAFDLAHYEIGDVVDVGLTPRVFKDNRPLRLMSLRNLAMRNAQLELWLAESCHTKPDENGKTIPVPLNWSHETNQPEKWAPENIGRITDSDIYESFLAVPIRNRQGRATGVLRFTEKSGGGGTLLYSAREDHLLERIAGELIGPRIEELLQSAMQELVFDNLPRINALSIEDAQHVSYNVSKGFGLALASLVPEGCRKGYRKRYLVNRIDWTQESSTAVFEPYSVGGSLPLNESLLRRRHAMKEDSVTFQSACPGQLILVHNTSDLPKLCEFMPDALCVLAAPISLRTVESGVENAEKKEVQPYGVFIIASERYDLDMSTHGRLLSVLAEQMAEIYTRRDYLHSLSIIGHMRHEIIKTTGRMRQLSESHFPENEKSEMLHLIEFIEDISRNVSGSSEELSSRVERQGMTVRVGDVVTGILPSLDAYLETDRTGLLNFPAVGADLQVKVYVPFLKGILFNAFCNACMVEARAENSSRAVLARFALDPGDLNLLIEVINRTASFPPEAIEEYASDLPGTGRWVGDQRPKNWGIHIIKTLADWHRVGGKRGKAVHFVCDEAGDWNGCHGVRIFLPTAPLD